ncbi:MAG: ABC transporter permease [Patescibacteria group bacterium]
MNNGLWTALIRQAFDSLRRQRTRSILTMLAMSIGVGAVVTIFAAGAGLERMVLGQLDVFGSDTLSIETRIPSTSANGTDNGGGQASGIVITTLKDRDLETVRKHPNILAAYGLVNGQEAVSYQGQLKKVMLSGYGYSSVDIDRLEFTEGRFFTREEELSIQEVAVLGSTAKEKLFGDQDAVGALISIRGKPFRVIGVTAPRGAAFFIDMDDVIIIPTRTMQKKLLGTDYFMMIIARMKDADDAATTKEDLQSLLRENHSIEDPSRDDFTVNTTAEAASILTTVTGGITILLMALIGISLVVGGVGIMNIMYVTVAERTFEIGLRKALGAPRRTILFQFLAEAVLVTVGGGLLGVAGGAVLAYGIYAAATSFGLAWVYSVSISSIFIAVGFSAVIGLVFGLYPARRAANLSPIEALRQE